jgi:hypothetical protein
MKLKCKLLVLALLAVGLLAPAASGQETWFSYRKFYSASQPTLYVRSEMTNLPANDTLWASHYMYGWFGSRLVAQSSFGSGGGTFTYENACACPGTDMATEVLIEGGLGNDILSTVVQIPMGMTINQSILNVNEAEPQLPDSAVLRQVDPGLQYGHDYIDVSQGYQMQPIDQVPGGPWDAALLVVQVKKDNGGYGPETTLVSPYMPEWGVFSKKAVFSFSNTNRAISSYTVKFTLKGVDYDAMGGVSASQVFDDTAVTVHK